MKKVKRIKISAMVKLHGLVFTFIGLILGILYSFGGLVIDSLVTLGLITSTETQGLSHGTILAFGALLGMPAIFALFGLITGAVVAILYNLIVKIFPRLKIDFS